MDQRQLCMDIKEICLGIAEKVDKLCTQSEMEITPATDLQNDALLNYLDVCQILHISIRQLRRLHASGKLVGFKNGRRRYYMSSEVQRYIQKLRNEQ